MRLIYSCLLLLPLAATDLTLAETVSQMIYSVISKACSTIATFLLNTIIPLYDIEKYKYIAVEYLDPQTSSLNVWGYAEMGYNAIAIGGIALSMFWFIMNIIDKLQQGPLTHIVLTRSATDFLVAVMLIFGGIKVIKLFFDLGAYSAKTVADLFESQISFNAMLFFKNVTGEYPSYFIKNLDGSFIPNYTDVTVMTNRLIKLLGYTVLILLGAMCTMIVNVYAIAALIMRVIEAVLYFIFTPVAIADVYHHGVLDAPGMRYIKKVISLGAQGYLIYAVIMICSQLTNSILGGLTNATFAGDVFGSFGRFIGILLVMMAEFGLVLQVQKFSHDIGGA